MNVSRRKALILVGAAAILGVVLFGAWAYHQLALDEKAINNLILFRHYGAALDDYKRAHGTYPASLAALDAVWQRSGIAIGEDFWRHPLHYERHGDTFVLVSYGRDGIPDGVDYWQIRVSHSYERICGHWDTDSVMSDLGIHKACGK